MPPPRCSRIIYTPDPGVGPPEVHENERGRVGESGASVGIDHFGASAPAETLYERFGVTSDAVVAAARALLKEATAAGAGAGA